MERLSFAAGDLDRRDVVCRSPGHAPSIVTTIGPNDVINLATFELTMVISHTPPRIILGIAKGTDTYQNLTDANGSGECVVGFPRVEAIQAAYDCGIKLPRDQSELDLVKGLTIVPSKVVAPPQLEQCWLNLECKFWQAHPAGTHEIVVLDILHVTVDADLPKDPIRTSRENLPAVYYTNSGNFFVSGERYVVKLSPELTKIQNGD